jgi:hypothetical protein
MAVLIEISPGEYRISGCQEYTKSGEKSVTVDGETYYKRFATQEVLDYDADFNKGNERCRGWIKYDFDELHLFGIFVTAWDYRWDYGSALSRMATLIYSQNTYANLFCHLHSLGIFGNKIRSVFCTRSMGCNDLEQGLFVENEVYMLLYEYAGGNGIYAAVSAQTYIDLEIPFPGFPVEWCYKKYFPELIERPKKFTDELKYTIADRLLNFQINYLNANPKQ